MSSSFIITNFLIVALIIGIFAPLFATEYRRKLFLYYVRRFLCFDKTAIKPIPPATPYRGRNAVDELNAATDASIRRAAANDEALKRAEAAWTTAEEEYVRHILLTGKLVGFTTTIEHKNAHTPEDIPSIGTMNPGSGSIDFPASSKDSFDDLEEGAEKSVVKELTEESQTSPPAAMPAPGTDKTSPGHIMLPLPGVSNIAMIENEISLCREVPNGCAICLGEFEEKDKVCWSSNENCSHAFHEDCMIDWVVAMARSRRRRQAIDGVTYDETDKKDIVDFRMMCPCCRQEFIIQENFAQERPSEDWLEEFQTVEERSVVENQ